MEISIDELQKHVVSQGDSWWTVDGARYLPIDLVMPVSGDDLGIALDRYKGKVVRVVVPDGVVPDGVAADGCPAEVSLGELLAKRGVIELEWNDDRGEREEWDLYNVTGDVRAAEQALSSYAAAEAQPKSSVH